MTTQSSAVVTFNFVTQTVRIVMRGDEPWFVAADVCNALSIAETHRALTRLDDDEKDRHTMTTPGGNQELSIINESGLYSLILTSRKPEAKHFKKWVTSEVLPAIRQTGRYEAPTAPQPSLSTRQYQALQDDAHEIGQSCHFGGSAKEAVYERIRFQYGLRSIRELRPEQFEAIQADLEGLKVLARQHFERMVTLDQEFIAAVLRPPVSIRKIRAMARKQEKQPPLQY
ncbi:MAG: Bro-N domain-containing protein [Gammaproteobacteria bacterium]|nr:Bro-N domain-containing protein [Gammaproteobacteria bacterium]